MTRKSETLKAKEEIQNLFKFGKRVKAKHISLVYIPNKTSSTRFLFCADRYARKANKRNRIKRVLRALVANNSNFIWGNVDIALIANYEFTKLSFDLRLKTLKFLCLKLES
ncbi:MAG: ribonuclease P protein component [Leptospiraceae bacterium]|nr:ribonuclease P protein component [Leptospiraceae bacterium]